MEASKQQGPNAKRMLVSNQLRASTDLPLWNQTLCSDTSTVHSNGNKYPPVMYAVRFAELVVWMWKGQAHVGARGVWRFLLRTANRSRAFYHNLNSLCSRWVQRHYDWCLVCLFIYLTTIFDCVSCVASNENMKMHTEKQRVEEKCLKARTSIYLKGLRRASATSQGCWHRNRKSNSGLLGRTAWLWPTDFFF